MSFNKYLYIVGRAPTINCGSNCNQCCTLGKNNKKCKNCSTGRSTLCCNITRECEFYCPVGTKTIRVISFVDGVRKVTTKRVPVGIPRKLDVNFGPTKTVIPTDSNCNRNGIDLDYCPTGDCNIQPGSILPVYILDC